MMTEFLFWGDGPFEFTVRWLCELMAKNLGWQLKACRFAWGDTWTYCAIGCSRATVSLKLLWINLLYHLASLRPLYVTVVYQGKYSHCMRIGVAVPLNSTVSRLREAVSRETKIPPEQVQFPLFFAKILRCYFVSNSGLGIKIFTVSLNTILVLH